ncbi:MAG: DUF3467 domain-containing protein [Acidobacteriota bacterium]|nr:DUF3467 domain-containing protein [Acidobacteriota bacterium]
MARKEHHEKQPASVATQGPQSGGLIPVGRNVSRSSTFVSIYANDVQIHTSPWDLRIVFGEIGDAVEGDIPSINVSQLGEVRVSPQLAKKLAEAIIAQVQAYERTFGKIPDVGVGT